MYVKFDSVSGPPEPLPAIRTLGAGKRAPSEPGSSGTVRSFMHTFSIAIPQTASEPFYYLEKNNH